MYLLEIQPPSSSLNGRNLFYVTENFLSLHIALSLRSLRKGVEVMLKSQSTNIEYLRRDVAVLTQQVEVINQILVDWRESAMLPRLPPPLKRENDRSWKGKLDCPFPLFVGTNSQLSTPRDQA